MSPLPLGSHLVVFVPGHPVPQGSMVAYGKAVVASNRPLLSKWRMQIATYVMEGAQAVDWQAIPPGAGVGVRLAFVFQRPKNHFGTGKNSEVVKALAPRFPSAAPDLDKLVRAVLDGLTDARVWDDDGQAVWIKASKHWVDHTWPSGEGVHITLGVMK